MGILAGILIAAALLLHATSARTPTPSPSPGHTGIIPVIVEGSTDVASWLSGLAVEYAGSPLWTTIAGIAIIILIVSLIMWLRRPRKPLDTDSPM